MRSEAKEGPIGAPPRGHGTGPEDMEGARHRAGLCLGALLTRCKRVCGLERTCFAGAAGYKSSL